MREIEIIIDDKGESVSIDMIGWKGKGCSEVVKNFASIIGKVKESSKKCEYFQKEVQQNVQKTQRSRL